MKIFFGLLVIVVLGIAGILVGGGAYAMRNRNKIHGARRADVQKRVPQITSVWDYRPRAVTLRDAAVSPDVKSETVQEFSSGPAALSEHDDVWFNFTNPETTVEKATQ